MCQLLGMNCNTPTDIMFSFTGFATRADEHKDGFGVAFFEGRGAFSSIRRARASPVARMIASYPIKSDNVVAHIRRRPRAAAALENCHPFVRELGPLLGVRAQRRPKDFAPLPYRGVPAGRRHRQRARSAG